jgi:hypothetical protein
MARLKKFMVCVALIGLVLAVTGCTTIRVAMNPRVPANELANKHIPCTVALLMDNTFQNYHWLGKSRAEMSKLDYDLGSASKSLFMESFMLVSKGIAMVDSIPPYSDPGRGEIAIVVKPMITDFSEEHSAWLRVVDYHAEITYHVTVYDKKGKPVLDKDYREKGVAKGHATISPGSNYAAPAEKAMEQAIVAIIGDISRLEIADK